MEVLRPNGWNSFVGGLDSQQLFWKYFEVTDEPVSDVHTNQTFGLDFHGRNIRDNIDVKIKYFTAVYRQESCERRTEGKTYTCREYVSNGLTIIEWFDDNNQWDSYADTIMFFKVFDASIHLSKPPDFGVLWSEQKEFSVSYRATDGTDKKEKIMATSEEDAIKNIKDLSRVNYVIG